MSHDWEQDFRTIGERLSDAPNEVLEELGGTEAEIASLAASGTSLRETCEKVNMEPDQVWAMINEALDRVQGTHWAEGPSGDTRPLDTNEIGHPTQGI